MAMSNMRFTAAVLLILAAAAAARSAEAPIPGVVELDGLSLDSAASKSPVLLMLHASWCGHCRKFMSSYGDVAKELAKDDVVVARADASQHRLLAQRFDLTGFPSFYYVENGKTFSYTGMRSVEGLVRFSRAGGREQGAEMTGFAAPMSVFWVTAAKALALWEDVRLGLIKQNLSPSVVVACLAGAFLLVLLAFACIINCVTKPAERRQKAE